MPADGRFVTRAYRPGDEAAILDLFRRSFNVSRSPARFRWEYERNPFGNEHISLTFDEQRRLVGHYAGYPVPFYESGRIVIAHHIGDVMTDPSVRHIGRGPTSIFGRTASHFYETFCEGKVAYNYGFTVGSHQTLSVRFLRAHRVEPVMVWSRQMPIARITRRHRWPRGYQLELLRDVGEEYDRFFDRVAPAYGFLALRDARYLRWRYLQCPDPGAFIVAIRKWRRLVGWSVFRVRDTGLSWGDALFDPRHVDAMEVLIRHVAPSYPVHRLEGWFPSRPRWFAGALERLGLAVIPEPQDLSLTCVPFTLPNATDRMRESLYYTMGDSDLF